jgi:hypothetical protein
MAKVKRGAVQVQVKSDAWWESVVPHLKVVQRPLVGLTRGKQRSQQRNLVGKNKRALAPADQLQAHCRAAGLDWNSRMLQVRKFQHSACAARAMCSGCAHMHACMHASIHQRAHASIHAHTAHHAAHHAALWLHTAPATRPLWPRKAAEQPQQLLADAEHHLARCTCTLEPSAASVTPRWPAPQVDSFPQYVPEELLGDTIPPDEVYAAAVPPAATTLGPERFEQLVSTVAEWLGAPPR